MSTPPADPDLSAANTSPLRHPAFRHYWFSRIAAMAASQIQVVAVGWQMYALTGQVFDLGLVGLAQFLPALLLALPAGLVADRFSRRRVLQLANAFKALCMGLLALASLQGWINRELIFVMAALLGATRAFEMPAHSALLSQIVPRELLPRAVAWSASATQGAAIVGPALGGFIYIAGAHVAYGSSALLSVVASALVALLPVQRVAAAQGPANWSFLLGGFRFIAGKPVVLGAISLDMFAVLLGGAAAMLPVFASDVLHTGPWGLGLLRSAEGLGALVMALLLAHVPLERRVGRTMFAAVLVFGLATMVFALSTVFVLSFAALVVMGAADMVSVVVRSSLIQLDTPDPMRGRVGAVNALFIGTSNQLGEFRAGVMGAWLGVVPAVAVGGLGILLVSLAWMRLFPGLRQRDQMHSSPG